MKGSAIRHLVASNLSPRIAAGEFEAKVSVWELETQRKLSELTTVLDFGGKRLGIDKKGERCVAGAYDAHGIKCYDAIAGKVLWQRKDLKKVQHIEIAPDGNTVGCGFDRGPLRILDMRDGQTVGELRGCRDLIISPYEPVQLADKVHPEIQTSEGRRLAKLERETFAILSVAFGLGSFVISESRGAVRCFDSSTAKIVWRYQPPADSHVLTLGYNTRLHAFMGVLWERGKTLLIFDPNTGGVQATYPLGRSVVEAFCLEGQLLVSSEGWLLECSTGRVCGSFDFPKKNYPD